MAGEIQVPYSDAGLTLYTHIRDRNAQIWHTSGPGAFEAYDTASYAGYTVQLTEQGVASAFYAGTFPPAIAPGIYGITVRRQAGADPAESDGNVGGGSLYWDGSHLVSLSDLATSGQVSQAGVPTRRGHMIRNFPFKLVSAADHVTPFTSGQVSGQIARDGGLFGPLQSGNITEMGGGWYNLAALTSGDLNADTVALTFRGVNLSGGASDSRDFSFLLYRSG